MFFKPEVVHDAGVVVFGAGPHAEGGHGVELGIREKKLLFVFSMHSWEEYVRMLENKKAIRDVKKLFCKKKLVLELLQLSEAIAYCALPHK